MSAVKKEETFMTSQDMLDRSSSWTLACDNALLNRLKKFSEDLSKASQEILKECDTLSKSVTQLDYRLINVSNEFLMLSNNQFVENRVEEFEEFSSSISSNIVTKIQKSKAEKEAALLSKMKQAIQLGITACDERRHRRDESQNPFKMKQPFLIGSPKFFSSKYCGLVDESRRKVPTYDDSYDYDIDSASIGQNNYVYAPSTQEKEEVKFTLPPTPVFPNKVIDANHENFAADNHSVNSGGKDSFGRPVVPPSPTVSDRSSEIGGESASTISKGTTMPRSVTDELNKIYGSFAPPPTADDDSDDDFRPSAGVGNIFNDDDDDIFEEKELFPSNEKKIDFFGRSNPSQLPAPVLSVPPPINTVPQTKIAVNDVQTLIGPKPNANNISSSMACVTSDIPREDDIIRGPPAESEGPSRTKQLPPGAVSMFGGLAPPVFNNGTLQAAPTARKEAPVLIAKPDTQISSHSSVETGSGLAPVLNKNNAVLSSQNREDVNQKYTTSQPSHNVATAGRTEDISQGSLSGIGVGNSQAKANQRSVPVSSLFADDSSDEDIFLSNKKKDIANSKNNIQSKEHPHLANERLSRVSGSNATNAISSTHKQSVVNAYARKSVFDDSESEDDLFKSKTNFSRGENKKISAANNDPFKYAKKKTSAPIKVNKSQSLFGDDSESDTDLFGNKNKVEVKSSIVTKTTQITSVPKMEDVKADAFWDDEDLFKENRQQEVSEEASSLCKETNNNNENIQESAKNEDQIQSSFTNSVNDKDKINPIAQEEKKGAIKRSIFDDSESDDDLFSSKPVQSVIAVKKDSSPVCDKKEPASSSKNNVKQQSSLFEDDSDSDSDLFGRKEKTNESQKVTVEDFEASTEKVPKSYSADKEETDIHEKYEKETNLQALDDVDGAALPSKEEIPSKCEDEKLKDEPKSAKTLGTKISEKIKAMQTSKTESSEADTSTKENIKSKISVKSLALNLNINPLALKVGAKPPKVGGSTPSTPDRDLSEAPTASDASLKSTSAVQSSDNSNVEEFEDVAFTISDEKKAESKNASDNVNETQNTPSADNTVGAGVDELVGILKARAKIQRKRRPPSRNFLKSLAVHVEVGKTSPNEQADEKEDLESKEESVEDKVEDVDDGKSEESSNNDKKTVTESDEVEDKTVQIDLPDNSSVTDVEENLI